MTFAEGSKLGPYEILAPIGSGRMGEVWKRLEQEVRSFRAAERPPADQPWFDCILTNPARREER